MGLGSLFQTRSVSSPVPSFIQTDSVGLWGADYGGAMSIPGAWRASILLSDIIGQLPFQAYRDRNGATEKLNPTPLLLSNPYPGDTAITTYSSLALDLLWHGNAVAIVGSRGSDGYPTSIVPVPADMVSIRWDGDELVYEYANKTYSAYDVLHVKGPTRPGCLRGMGRLENHLSKTFTLADEQATQARSLGTHGVPSGIFKSTDPTFDEDAARALKRDWTASQSQRTVAFLNSTTDFVPLGWNPEETQLLEARKFSLHEIAIIFGLDPSWLGVSGASMTYSNIEQEAINLLKFSVSGNLTRIEQGLSQLLPRGTWAKANTDAMLRTDTLSRYQAHQLGITAGFLTIDEARALEDLPALEAA